MGKIFHENFFGRPYRAHHMLTDESVARLRRENFDLQSDNRAKIHIFGCVCLLRTVRTEREALGVCLPASETREGRRGVRPRPSRGVEQGGCSRFWRKEVVEGGGSE